ncbi:hypothetical protein L6452_09665 [Arctium lappa]|uniref:Uncharacterized protein n=1 Tax=Arctium lappa TaxID=4217 RepID=A0ACB9DKN9_ARCLA|nr:hypothetical protein L6452_09665 [Arctium lappa]
MLNNSTNSEGLDDVDGGTDVDNCSSLVRTVAEVSFGTTGPRFTPFCCKEGWTVPWTARRLQPRHCIGLFEADGPVQFCSGILSAVVLVSLYSRDDGFMALG